MSYDDSNLEYAATARCQCGAGVAHPIDTADALRLGAWTCAAVLKGEATGDEHAVYPFAFWKIREESSINNRAGLTTRPAGTRCLTQGKATCPKCGWRCLTQGKATCPKCGWQWKSEPYSACGLSHHWFSGPCPECGYAVGANGSWSSSEGEPIECRYRTVIVDGADA